jgi:Zn-dependent protease with chaperone function
MKYTASLPEVNDNISPVHPLKDAAVILGWLLAIAALVFWLTGLAIDRVVDGLSPETEASLARMLPSHSVAADPALASEQARLQALADSMRPCARMSLPATITLSKSEVPNALAMPGGHVVVFSGLLDKVKSENGQAFVLAHEMAHLAHRDHLRAMGRGIVLFGIAALVTGSDSGLSEVLAPAQQLGAASYSRSRESAADALALQILNCRYGHAGGATEFFEVVRAEDKTLFGLSHYAASHPAVQERIDALNAAIRAGAMKVEAVQPVPILR